MARVYINHDAFVEREIYDVQTGKGFTRGWIFWNDQRWVVAQKRRWVIERRYDWMVEYHRWFKEQYGWPK